MIDPNLCYQRRVNHVAVTRPEVKGFENSASSFPAIFLNGDRHDLILRVFSFCLLLLNPADPMGNQASRQDGSAVRISDRSLEHNQHPNRQPNGLSRSRSVRANMVTTDAGRHGFSKPTSEPSRYLPRGLDKAHNGIVMPRMPYGTQIDQSSSNDGGVESPQWGWFLRTTPPTPQMYYPRAPAAVQRHATTSSTNVPLPVGAPRADPSIPSAVPSSFTSSSADSSLPASSHPNPVFQGLQDKHQAAAGMGWSSLPL